MSKFLALIMLACANIAAYATVTYHTVEVPGGYDFVFYAPDTVSEPMPLIISLHSRSASGNYLRDVDRFGTIDAIESGMRLDACVLAPQATGDRWDAEKIMKDVEYVIAKWNIDPDRVYAIGMSMGGDGVAELASLYPDRIAAAIILGGGAPSAQADSMSQVPLWVIRGLNDRPGAIRRTDDMVESIRAIDDSRIAYSRVKGVDHRQHERMLYMPCFYQWLLSHTLRQPGRPVSPTFDITSRMLKDAYRGLRLRTGSAALRPPHEH